MFRAGHGRVGKTRLMEAFIAYLHLAHGISHFICASAYAAMVGSKPWRYLLVPHDQIVESMRLSDFLRFEVER